MTEKRPVRNKRSAGSKTVGDVIREQLGLPPSKHSMANQHPLEGGRGQVVDVSCFLRGDLEGFPRRWRQGLLVVNSGVLEWRPFWRDRRSVTLLGDKDLRVVEVREVDRSDLPWIKPRLFLVIECDLPGVGSVGLAVPREDAPLVRSALTSQPG